MVEMIGQAVGAYTNATHGMTSLGSISGVLQDDHECRTGWGVNPEGRSESELAESGLKALESWMREIGVVMNIKELGVTPDMYEGIADATFLLGGGYKKLTRDEVIAILNSYSKGEHVTMSRKLVVYFSASGVTASVAQKLAQAAGADLYEIKPAVKYTSQDLNWNDSNSRSSIEMRDKSSRPAIADRNAILDGVDVVFLGFPIWWYVAPTIINTFLESYDFTGKTIILFATSGGSGFGNAVSGLKASAPGAVIREGKLFRRNVSADELKKWAESLNV